MQLSVNELPLGSPAQSSQELSSPSQIPHSSFSAKPPQSPEQSSGKLSGGGDNPLDQDREQWTDGANALAIDDGVVILYTRNTHTINELKNSGYDIISTDAAISNPDIITHKTVITLDGPELCRGRGGARCLTLPIVRGVDV